MALPNYSYGTQATVFGKSPTDSYYVLDAQGGGGTVIPGNLTVQGSITSTGAISAPSVTSAFNTVTDPNGNAIQIASSAVNYTDAGVLKFTERPNAAADTFLITNAAFQGINIDQATGNVTHTAATTMNGTTTVSRATAGVDGYLKVLNAGGEGIGIRAFDPTSGPNGTVLLQTVINSTTNGATALQFDASGVVTITSNNIIGAPSTQRIVPQNGTVNPTPGVYTINVPQGGVGLIMSTAFTVDITHAYRWSFTLLNTSTVGTTGELQIGIYDAAGTSRQIACFSAPNASLAAAAGIGGGFSGIFQPAVTSVAFYGFNVGAAADTLLAFSSGLGAVAGFKFVVEDLGVA
jgi:hypothetical protein